MGGACSKPSMPGTCARMLWRSAHEFRQQGQCPALRLRSVASKTSFAVATSSIAIPTDLNTVVSETGIALDPAKSSPTSAYLCVGQDHIPRFLPHGLARIHEHAVEIEQDRRAVKMGHSSQAGAGRWEPGATARDYRAQIR